MSTTQNNVPTPNTMLLFRVMAAAAINIHTLHNCQLIQDLLHRGLLVYDQWRHITLPHDKGPLRREGGEMLLDVYYQTTQRREESPLRED